MYAHMHIATIKMSFLFCYCCSLVGWSLFFGDRLSLYISSCLETLFVDQPILESEICLSLLSICGDSRHVLPPLTNVISMSRFISTLL